MAKKEVLPEKFLERCEEIFGPLYFNRVKDTFVRRPVTFRVNTLLSNRLEVLQGLRDLGFKLKSVPWYDLAFILENKSQRDLEATDFYRQGKIYLQSLASMVPPLVLAPAMGEKVLDLCAAPGGKTSEMASFMNSQGELWAVEIDEVRFEKLRHNMKILGADRRPGFLNLYHGDGMKFCLDRPGYFDKILLDAPCGAEARIVADEKRSWGFWQEKKIKDQAFLQRRLLFSAFGALKPGGTLVYSTCTFAPEENEEQIVRLSKKFGDAVVIQEAGPEKIARVPAVRNWRGEEWDRSIDKILRILPTKEIEGFFVAKIRKDGKA